MKVILDAGHGGRDPGAVANGIEEKDLTLSLVLQTKKYLEEQYKIESLLTRSSDHTISLDQRTLLANKEGVDYFISFHHNLGGGTGFESFIYPGMRHTKTGNMQDKVHRHLMTFYKKYGLRDRGKKEANFHVLRNTVMPAILLENLFLDTLYDASLLKQESFLHDLSKHIALGIYRALTQE